MKAEQVLAKLVASARGFGDEVIHAWVLDLQDGSFNVKMIMRFKEGNVGTVGLNVGAEA